MAISLYDVSVKNFLQTLGAVSGYLDKGLKWANENGHDGAEIVETRLHGDMLPFRFQIVSVCHHSRGAIAGAKAGVFSPPGPSDATYAGLQALVAEALAELKRADARRSTRSKARTWSSSWASGSCRSLSRTS